MSDLDGAMPCRNWRTDDAICAQPIQPYGTPYDVGDRVDCTDLMEMNFLKRTPMNFGLSLT